MTSGAVFAAVFAVLFASHVWADHCWQTDKQAGEKGRPEPGAGATKTKESWRALIAHVVIYHVVVAGCLR